MNEVPETKYARNGDVHIAYQVFGQGDVTFVGAPAAISNIEVLWEDPSARRFLTRMGSFCRFVHYDKRGQGMSDRDSGVPTMDERLDDLRAVLDAAGVDRAVLGGISEGASTMAMFAAQNPERVSKLFLFGAPLRTVAAPDYPYALDEESFDRFTQAMVDHWGTPETIAVAVCAPSMRGDEHFLRWWNRFERQSCSPGALLAAFSWIKQIDIRAVLPSIRVPTLIAHRRGDRMCSVEQSRHASTLIPDAQYVELEGHDHMPWFGNQDEVVDLMQEFITGAAPVRELDRVLSTVLFTDIVDSTVRSAELGDGRWKYLLDQHDEIVTRELGRHRGTQIKSMGDGMLATFDGPARAVRCAQAICSEMRSLGLEVRAGLHTGEIELRGDDVAGLAVVIGQRISALATAGEVLVSSTVKDLTAGSGINFEDRGLATLKGIPHAWQVFVATAG